MTTLPGQNLLVTFTIATRNRREALLRTLEQVHQCGLSHEAFEIILVDNASDDGTAEAVTARFPDVRVIALAENRGSCAKNDALRAARGRYIVFLDDDSYPQPGSIEQMVRHFEADAGLGAAVFTVRLPGGGRECSAYPDVFIGCGTGFRAAALRQVGGLPDDFFMQAEEYDLSLRLLDAGWGVRTFADLEVVHLKTPAERSSSQKMRLDVRNNLLVAARRFPAGWAAPFAMDWMRRYRRMARASGQRRAFWAGLLHGAAMAIAPGQREPVGSAVFDRFTRMSWIAAQMQRRREQLDLRSVLFIDWGKNILPYWLAAARCGIEVVAIADNRLAGHGRYRGVPVVSDIVARRLDFDAAIVSNSSPVHAAERARAWRAIDQRPVIDLLEADRGAQNAHHEHPGAMNRTLQAA